MLTISQYIQLIAAVVMANLIFVWSYFGSVRIVVTLIILMIPFQLVDSYHGTSNVVLVYVVALALFLRRYLTDFPLWWSVGLMLLAYFFSFSMAEYGAYKENFLYLISVFSAVLVFYIAYNYSKRVGTGSHLINLLLVMNVLVVIYCFIQVIMPEGFSYGLLTMHGARGGDVPRLRGPFEAVGITAEYLVISSMLVIYELMNSGRDKKKLVLYALLAANFFCLVATGNRGGFISLIIGCLMFLFVFRKQLKFINVLKYILIISLVLGSGSLFVIKFTDYGSLYQRLSETKIESGVPDNRRSSWAEAVGQIQNNPMFGHGPKFMLRSVDVLSGYKPMQFPHNLYLFLLHTVGIFGLCMFLLWFFSVFLYIRSSKIIHSEDQYRSGLLKLGQIILIIILIDQIKVEFMRFALVDYWHYLFCILGIFVGIADQNVVGKDVVGVDLIDDKDMLSVGVSK